MKYYFEIQYLFDNIDLFSELDALGIKYRYIPGHSRGNFEIVIDHIYTDFEQDAMYIKMKYNLPILYEEPYYILAGGEIVKFHKIIYYTL